MHTNIDDERQLRRRTPTRRQTNTRTRKRLRAKRRTVKRKNTVTYAKTTKKFVKNGPIQKFKKLHADYCDAMMHVLKDFINLKYSELLTEEISKSN